MSRAAKPKAGRPTLGKGDTVPIQIKVPAELRERIGAAAEADECSLSDWLRDAAERKLARR